MILKEFIVPILISLLSSAGFVAFIQWLGARKKIEAEAEVTLADGWEKMVTKLQIQMDMMEKKLDERNKYAWDLEKQVRELSNKVEEGNRRISQLTEIITKNNLHV